MGWTKRQFIIEAYTEIGYASYEFDLEPEQLQIGLRRLDSMIATWNGLGIRLGYPIPSSPELSNLDDETEVPDSSNEAIYTNLAIRLAPPVGKMVTPETKAAAKAAYNVVLARASFPNERQLPGDLPAGAGNKGIEFISPPTDPLRVGKDGTLDFN
ncbi:MAG: hypothetical protein GY774_36175 [Planctomycetes bacterium]|nr:hypothetical protein [Planctomycetota bacterium]